MSNKNCYENLLADLNKGQVTGLEEIYHELKQKSGFITEAGLKKIINQVQQNYQVSFKNIISHFSKESLETLRISEIISALISSTNKKLMKMQNKPNLSIINPSPSKIKFPSVEFINLSFLDFKARLDFFNDWVAANLETFPTKQLIREFLAIAKIQASDLNLKGFTIELKKLEDPKKQLVISEFRALAFAWYQSCHSTQDLRAKLLQTISEFEELKAKSLPDNEKTSLDDLIDNLKSKLKEIPNYSISEENFEDKCIAGLHQIFMFYSKQQFLLGKTPTFESIKANTEVLTIGKFLRFCKDFSIIDEKDRQRCTRMIKEAQSAFTQTADCGRTMHEHHFLASLDLISGAFFDEEYDKVHNTSWKSMPSQDKRIKFYEFLKCHNPDIFQPKLRGSIPHFGVEPYNRIPDYDLSKKYKPQPERIKEMKKNVEEWKARKGNNDNKVRVSGYAQKKNKFMSYAEKHRLSKRVNKIDWQNLEAMSPKDFRDDEDNELEDLVQSSDHDDSRAFPAMKIGIKPLMRSGENLTDRPAIKYKNSGFPEEVVIPIVKISPNLTKFKNKQMIK